MVRVRVRVRVGVRVRVRVVASRSACSGHVHLRPLAEARPAL